MNESAIKTENVFLFWRAIEALTPQDIDKENARDKLNPVYKVGAGTMLPWMTRIIPVRMLRLAKCGATPHRRGFII